MLKVDQISFSYDQGTVLEEISFGVARGEHVSILGESGCGKSTLLKIIYGLLPLGIGEVHWGEKQVMGPEYNLVPGEPYMKYLSQEFELMPFTTVRENIGQFLSAFDQEEFRERTNLLMEMIELADFADVKIRDLSGGQQQRVAIARVLAQEPEILLLDEPFSHIDNFSKNRLRRKVFDYLKQKGITCITATHDSNDVLPFADRIIVLKDKRIVADEVTLTLYEKPGELYIASLFGEANRIPINIVKSYADTKRRIVVYAHEFKISQTSGLEVEVIKAYLMGPYFLVTGIAEGHTVYFHSDKVLEQGAKVFLNVSLETLNKRLAP